MNDRVALVVDADGWCINAVVLGSGWSPPDSCRLVDPVGDEWIGWQLIDGVWTPPPEEP